MGGDDKEEAEEGAELVVRLDQRASRLHRQRELHLGKLFFDKERERVRESF